MQALDETLFSPPPRYATVHSALPLPTRTNPGPIPPAATGESTVSGCTDWLSLGQTMPHVQALKFALAPQMGPPNPLRRPLTDET